MSLIGFELLGPAMGVALSPLPIMIVLLLIIARNINAAVSYVLGWVAGLLIVGVILVYLSDLTLHQGNKSESTAIGIALILLGMLFVTMAVVTLRGKIRKRPAIAKGLEAETSAPVGIAAGGGVPVAPEGSAATMQTAREMAKATTTPLTVDSEKPGWMRAIDSISPLVALAIALASAFNPKNLSMILMAVADIHEAGFSPTRGSIAYLNFVALATVAVAAPLLYWLIKRDAADELLQKCEKWLSANQAYIMSALFLVLGVMAIVKGWRRLPA